MIFRFFSHGFVLIVLSDLPRVLMCVIAHVCDLASPQVCYVPLVQWLGSSWAAAHSPRAWKAPRSIPVPCWSTGSQLSHESSRHWEDGKYLLAGLWSHSRTLECLWLLRCGLIWCSDTLYSPPVSSLSGVWRLGTVLGKREVSVPAWFHLLMISTYSESMISSGIGQFSEFLRAGQALLCVLSLRPWAFFPSQLLCVLSSWTSSSDS